MQVNRRQALAIGTTAALSATQSAYATLRHRSRVPLKLGLVTYNWGKMWDVPTIIKNCSDTGFTGVELRSTHRHGVEITLNGPQRQEIRQQFADSPVELMGLGSACEYDSPDPGRLKKNIQETRAFLQLSHDVGATGVKVRPNHLHQDVPSEQTIEQIGRSLNAVGQMAADLGQQIRVEVHGRGTSEIPVMKAIMDIADHPSVGVCWNCNQNDLHGEGFQHNFDLLSDRLATVHIHDLRGEQYPWKDLFASLKTVKADGFTGWTLLEDGKVPNDIVAAMHENTRQWQQLVQSS